MPRYLQKTQSEVIECFVASRGQTGSRNVVTKYSPIDDLGVESSLRDKFREQTRYILLALRRKGFLVARATAEPDHDCFPRAWESSGATRCEAEQSRSRAGPGNGAQKFAAGVGAFARDLEKDPVQCDTVPVNRLILPTQFE